VEGKGGKGRGEWLTQTELHDHEPQGARNLPDEQLDLDQQAVLRAGCTAAAAAAASAGCDDRSPAALGDRGGGGREGRGDGLKVRGERSRGGVLLCCGRVVLDGGRGLVCVIVNVWLVECR